MFSSRFVARRSSVKIWFLGGFLLEKLIFGLIFALAGAAGLAAMSGLAFPSLRVCAIILAFLLNIRAFLSLLGVRVPHPDAVGSVAHVKEHFEESVVLAFVSQLLPVELFLYELVVDVVDVEVEHGWHAILAVQQFLPVDAV
jgi:hypothetical protein